VAPHTQSSRFLTEEPFNLMRPFEGTLTFEASGSVGALALLSVVNQRSEVLTTALPVAPLTATPANSRLIVPHYADGGGWRTGVILINPTGGTIGGNVLFAAAANPVAVPYTVAPRSQRIIQTSGLGDEIRAGAIWITPDDATAAPAASALLSFAPNGMTVSVAGVPAVPEGSGFDLYAESSGSLGEAGSLGTGVAIANPSVSEATVHLELFGLDGAAVAVSRVVIAGGGHLGVFLNQLAEFAGVANPFQGVLRVRSQTAISLMGFRGRYNERGDFLIAALPPIGENRSPGSGELVLPMLVAGGGATTEVIVFGCAGRTVAELLRLFSHRGERWKMGT
jgi:hypothetical protein